MPVEEEKVGSYKPPSYPFKNNQFKHSNISNGKKKPWKTLKQILAQEQTLSWPETAVTYSSLDAPPSFKPSKKYSDLSGLEAVYTDPQTRLNYSNAEEFQEIRRLPSDIVQGYLSLRKANTLLQ
ncbi:INO80 complex subunit C-like [Eurytemora carolleeae]|uniref:INO80 complex subunit C-like n=1 Tax=Eurytemora carolleeae TaxID=1294199 RepID=UPI000C78E555|nr:INO80 complex subunit C-like [Eurytemora carolleeae]|eukprot:XP_023323310.1 INO80 complex subunit C-like [Eurytemora affinis]